MTKKIICFGLKNQKYNPKIKEGQLIGIAIQTWRDYVWSSCGYLMIPNNQEAIQHLEKGRNQEHVFLLEAEIRVEKFTEDVISDEGKKLGTIGKQKIYIEDPDWDKKIKLLYCRSIEYFVPKKVVKNENNLLHVEIDSIEFYQEGLIDKLVFKGEKINQYRDLIVKNLGKEFKMPSLIFDSPTSIDTNEWSEKKKNEMVEEKISDRPGKTISEIKNSLEEYYRNNDIKTMGLSNEDKEFLDIVFNSGKKQNSNTFSNYRDKQKIEQVKIYLQSNNAKSLDYSELIGVPKQEQKDKNNFNWTPWLIGGIISFLAIILFFVIKKKWKKSYVK